MSRYKLLHPQIQNALDNDLLDASTVDAANDPYFEQTSLSQEDLWCCELHYACEHPECKRLGCAYHRTRQRHKGGTEKTNREERK